MYKRLLFNPLRGWVLGVGFVDPVTAPLPGMLCHGLTTFSPSGTFNLRNLNYLLVRHFKYNKNRIGRFFSVV